MLKVMRLLEGMNRERVLMKNLIPYKNITAKIFYNEKYLCFFLINNSRLATKKYFELFLERVLKRGVYDGFRLNQLAGGKLVIRLREG